MASGRFRFAVLVMLAAADFVFAGVARAGSGPLQLSAFARETGMRVSAEQVQQTWAALEAMGTTKYLGGMLGSLRLDESAMIAGALSIGASEFDALLNGGGLNTASTTAGQELVNAMTKGAGIDLSYLTGSYTEGGGGRISSLAVTTGSAAVSGAEACDATVASEMVANGKAYVDGVVQTAMSEEYGFSKISDLTPTGGAGSGFAAMSCLDKLFQNAGSDLLFKPPSLGSLTTQLQNWVCGDAVSVAEQVAGAFGDGEIFDTAALGGFYPGANFSEAFESSPLQRLGMGHAAAETFGQSFADFDAPDKSQIQASADITRLFR